MFDVQGIELASELIKFLVAPFFPGFRSIFAAISVLALIAFTLCLRLVRKRWLRIVGLFAGEIAYLYVCAATIGLYYGA